MLLLGSKTMTIDGITVFFDHADPAQFWYLPAPVRLARRAEDHRAAFTFIKYKPAAVAGGAKGGGFVTFEVNLKLDTEQERRILSKLTSVSRGRPKLAVVPFDEGTVQCIALNIQGAGGTAATSAAAGTFNAVEKILGASVPSLHGDNSAAFSLTLSQEGATILEEAFEKGTTPIGVIYDLKFTGMRPALDVKITADFKRVYDHFSAGLNAQVYFVQAGIDAGFEKLVQDGVIKIEVFNFTGDADLKEKEKWVLDFFKDNLLSEWFKPTLTPGQLAGGMAQAESLDNIIRRGNELRPPSTPPPPPRGTNTQPPPNLGPSPTAGIGPADEHVNPFSASATGANSATGADTATGTSTGTSSGDTSSTATDVSPTEGLHVPPIPTPAPPTAGTRPGVSANAANALTNAAAGAGSMTPVVSFKLKLIKQEELKTISLQYKVSEATQRTYAPQGFFGLLLADLDNGKHFVEVDLDDPFFRVFSVTIDAPIDYARIGLKSAHVSLDYGNSSDATNHKHGDFVFDAVNKDPKRFEVFMNKNRDTAYKYQVQYHFDPTSDWEGEKFSYDLPVEITEDRTQLINPFDQIGFLEIKVSPHRIDAGAIESIDVILEYAEKNGKKREKTVTVLPNSPPQFWRLRLSDPTQRSYSYRQVHHLKDGTIRETPLVTTRATTILVDDPFEEAIEIELVPAFDNTKVRQVFVDIEYRDEEKAFERNERITMKGNAVEIVSLRLSILDPKKKEFRYRLTFVGNDGKINRKAFVTTDDPFISVSE